MSIDASMVKELRSKTGAGIMDCKKALSESKGDVDEAIAFLRKKGLATAAKKAGRSRHAAQSLSASSKNCGVMSVITSCSANQARSRTNSRLERRPSELASTMCERAGARASAFFARKEHGD